MGRYPEARRFDDEGRLILDLGDTIRRIKSEFGIEQVLAWHAMVGYWAGVEPEASEMGAFGAFITKLLAPKGIRQVDPKVRPMLGAAHHIQGLTIAGAG